MGGAGDRVRETTRLQVAVAALGALAATLGLMVALQEAPRRPAGGRGTSPGECRVAERREAPGLAGTRAAVRDRTTEARLAPAPTAVDGQATAPAWRALLARLPTLAAREVEAMRGAVEDALAAALHPTADFPGGTDALRVAAALGDRATWDAFLDLIRHRDRVVAKLPLTETRDDLVFLEVVAGAVRAKGTEGQRATLARLLRSEQNREPDPEVRARLAAPEEARGDR